MYTEDDAGLLSYWLLGLTFSCQVQAQRSRYRFDTHCVFYHCLKIKIWSVCGHLSPVNVRGPMCDIYLELLAEKWTYIMCVFNNCEATDIEMLRFHELKMNPDISIKIWSTWREAPLCFSRQPESWMCSGFRDLAHWAFKSVNICNASSEWVCCCKSRLTSLNAICHMWQCSLEVMRGSSDSITPTVSGEFAQKYQYFLPIKNVPLGSPA